MDFVYLPFNKLNSKIVKFIKMIGGMGYLVRLETFGVKISVDMLNYENVTIIRNGTKHNIRYLSQDMLYIDTSLYKIRHTRYITQDTPYKISHTSYLIQYTSQKYVIQSH